MAPWRDSIPQRQTTRVDGGSAEVLPLIDDVLTDLFRRLNTSTAAELSGGGTPARVFRLRTPRGAFVLKYLVDRAGRVDGHDLETFLEKPSQINLVRSAAPRLATRYTRTTGVWRGDGWGAYAMPFHPGTALNSRSWTPLHLRTHTQRLVRTLCADAWPIWQRPAPPEHFVDCHVRRVDRRLPVVAEGVPQCVLAGDVRVNGRSTPAWVELRASLTQPGRAEMLQPTALQLPVHGDLSLGNVLVNGNDFVLIDPRGTQEPWDAVYDLAKIVFSLLTYDILRSVRLDAVGRDLSLFVGGSTAERMRTALGVVTAARQTPWGAELDRTDPAWERRLWFAVAIHHLAEAACRISDAESTASATARAADHALKLWLLGALLLEALLATDGEQALAAIAYTRAWAT